MKGKGNRCCHPFIARTNSPRASLLPAKSPPITLRVNNTPRPFVRATRRDRSVSLSLSLKERDENHDEFLFRGFKRARARAHGSSFSSAFAFALASSPLAATAIANPLRPAARPPFLISSSVDETRSHAERHGASDCERSERIFLKRRV